MVPYDISLSKYGSGWREGGGGEKTKEKYCTIALAQVPVKLNNYIFLNVCTK
jgi:hypothetical protein